MVVVSMRKEIRALHDRLGATSVYVTHDQIEAMTMADKIVVMNGGNIEQIGKPLDLYDRPANLFVAGFIGSPAMNMLKGTISGGALRMEDGTAWPLPANGAATKDGPAVYGIRPEHFILDRGGIPATVHDGRLDAESFTLPLPASHAVSNGQKVWVGVRPENLLPGEEQGRGVTARVQGVVDLVEPVGHQAIVHTSLGKDVLVAAFDAHHMPKIGQTLDLVVELDALHLFDAATENRI